MWNEKKNCKKHQKYSKYSANEGNIGCNTYDCTVDHDHLFVKNKGSAGKINKSRRS